MTSEERPGEREAPRAAQPGAARPPSFLRELNRRNVVRVGVLYGVVCRVILEPLHVVFDLRADHPRHRVRLARLKLPQSA